MSATNSGEHYINWSTKLHKRDKVVKAVANLVCARGDGVYEQSFTAFQDNYLYSLSQQPVCTVLKDSHKLFGHSKSIAVLSNN